MIKFRLYEVVLFSLPGVINVKFSPQPHQKYDITQYGELGFSQLTQMKDYYATNSFTLPHIHVFISL